MAIEHRATDGFRGNRKPLCGANPTRWSADATPCPECERIFAEAASQPAQPPTQAEIDRAMARAGFEAAGNAGDIWNRLNPLNGERF